MHVLHVSENMSCCRWAYSVTAALQTTRLPIMSFQDFDVMPCHVIGQLAVMSHNKLHPSFEACHKWHSQSAAADVRDIKSAHKTHCLPQCEC